MRTSVRTPLLPISFVLAACGGKAPPAAPKPCAASLTCETLEVGPAGGELSDSDDSATVSIPPGAFDATTGVQVASLPLPADFVVPVGAVVVGSLFEVVAPGPSAPLVLTLAFDPSKLGSLCTTHGALATAQDVQVLTSPSGAAGTWTLLSPKSVDSDHVSATTDVAQFFVPVVVTYEIDPAKLGFAMGQVIPNFTLQGPSITNTANPPTVDSQDQSSWGSSFSFEWLHDQSCAGLRYAYLDLTAQWCPYCAGVAEDFASADAQKWIAEGGLVVSLLEEGMTGGDHVPRPPSGSPATPEEMASWIKHYDVDYTLAIDEQQTVEDAAGVMAWPMAFFVRLSDMRVMLSTASGMNALEGSFESTLAQCDLSVGTGCTAGMACSDDGLCK